MSWSGRSRPHRALSRGSQSGNNSGSARGLRAPSPIRTSSQRALRGSSRVRRKPTHDAPSTWAGVLPSNGTRSTTRVQKGSVAVVAPNPVVLPDSHATVHPPAPVRHVPAGPVLTSSGSCPEPRQPGHPPLPFTSSRSIGHGASRRALHARSTAAAGSVPSRMQDPSTKLTRSQRRSNRSQRAPSSAPHAPAHSSATPRSSAFLHGCCWLDGALCDVHALLHSRSQQSPLSWFCLYVQNDKREHPQGGAKDHSEPQEVDTRLYKKHWVPPPR